MTPLKVTVHTTPWQPTTFPVIWQTQHSLLTAQNRVKTRKNERPCQQQAPKRPRIHAKARTIRHTTQIYQTHGRARWYTSPKTTRPCPVIHFREIGAALSGGDTTTQPTQTRQNDANNIPVNPRLAPTNPHSELIARRVDTTDAPKPSQVKRYKAVKGRTHRRGRKPDEYQPLTD